MHEHQTVKVNHDGATLHIQLPLEATVSDLKTALKERRGITLPVDWQLIANGTEQGDKVVLRSLGEYYFRSNAMFLRALNDAACREWQSFGKCRQGSKCPLHKTHTMEFSPRYVAHTSPQASPREEGASATQSSPAQSSQFSPPSPPRSPPAGPVDEALVCRNWIKDGSCRFGDRCHFAGSHSAANLPTSMVLLPEPSQQVECSPCASPQPVSLCRNWITSGNCRFEDRCHFASSHTAANRGMNQHSVPSPQFGQADSAASANVPMHSPPAAAGPWSQPHTVPPPGFEDYAPATDNNMPHDSHNMYNMYNSTLQTSWQQMPPQMHMPPQMQQPQMQQPQMQQPQMQQMGPQAWMQMPMFAPQNPGFWVEQDQNMYGTQNHHIYAYPGPSMLTTPA